MSAPSARGLFRATGKKSKPVIIRDIEGSLVEVDELEREEIEALIDVYREAVGV